ncbi:MAG: nucleoside monophosphate kinase [Candidatus Jacksonbacteria bacterium]|nr:nucleoside monophosphate kinase [Candidatus Jacksonbacteria bacterium]
MKPLKRHNILIFGPQGSGKGTQAEILSKKFGIPAISAGAALRRIGEKNNDRGRKVKEYLNKGELVPGELTNEIMRERILESDCENGFIWDGFPRNQEQANFIIKQNIPVDLVIVLKLPDEIGVSRIAGRLTCSNGHSYHIKFAPPKVAGFCDHPDRLPLLQRDDETEEAIKERLRIYHNETEQLIEIFRERGAKIFEIDAQPKIMEVANEIQNKIDETFNI